MEKPKGHVLLINVAKPRNLGIIVRSAAAFNF